MSKRSREQRLRPRAPRGYVRDILPGFKETTGSWRNELPRSPRREYLVGRTIEETAQLVCELASIGLEGLKTHKGLLIVNYASLKFSPGNRITQGAGRLLSTTCLAESEEIHTGWTYNYTQKRELHPRLYIKRKGQLAEEAKVLKNADTNTEFLHEPRLHPHIIDLGRTASRSVCAQAQELMSELLPVELVLGSPEILLLDTAQPR